MITLKRSYANNQMYRYILQANLVFRLQPTILSNPRLDPKHLLPEPKVGT